MRFILIILGWPVSFGSINALLPPWVYHFVHPMMFWVQIWTVGFYFTLWISSIQISLVVLNWFFPLEYIYHKYLLLFDTNIMLFKGHWTSITCNFCINSTEDVNQECKIQYAVITHANNSNSIKNPNFVLEIVGDDVILVQCLF